MAEVDVSHLREVVETLERIERPSASPGEREAAEWIRDRFEALGVPARIEEERAHGTYWVPLGLMSAAAAVAGRFASRPVATAVGALAAAGIADDVSGGPHVFRRALPHRSTANVVAELGEADAERTIVFVAHHDAAHGGLIFDPRLVEAIADRFPDAYERANTSPQVMALVAGGPALMALGALTGRRRLRAAGTVIAAGCVAAFTDIALRPVVPGANDNLSSVAAILELARLLRDDPPPGVRVVLVSTGSEESSMEGMRGFMRRHATSLPRDRTRVICLESLGSPQLIVIEGEGMLRMRDYPQESREFLAACGERAGAPLRRGLRLGFATDGLIALKAGYPCATLASVTKYKFTANYHQLYDVAERLEWGSIAGAVRVCREAVRASARAPERAPARAW
jgi:hypothetical protein